MNTTGRSVYLRSPNGERRSRDHLCSELSLSVRPGENSPESFKSMLDNDLRIAYNSMRGQTEVRLRKEGCNYGRDDALALGASL